MNVQQVCDSAIGDIEGGLGCLLVDLQEGGVLGFAKHPAAVFHGDDVQQLIRLGSDLFRGELIGLYAQSLLTEDVPPGEFVQEAQVTTADASHFLATIPGWGAAAIMLIVKRSKNLGLSWVAIRQAREQLAQFQPDEIQAALASDSGGAWQRALQRPRAARAHVPVAPKPELSPVAADEGHPPASKPRESNARLAPPALTSPELPSEEPDEPNQNVSFGARSQMYRPRENRKKQSASSKLARRRWPRT